MEFVALSNRVWLAEIMFDERWMNDESSLDFYFCLRKNIGQSILKIAHPKIVCQIDDFVHIFI